MPRIRSAVVAILVFSCDRVAGIGTPRPMAAAHGSRPDARMDPDYAHILVL